MRIAVIGTVSSSLLGFRAPLISKLVENGHTVYALAMDYTCEKKKMVESLGVIPVSYSMRRYGVNPFIDIMDTIRLKRLLTKLKVDVTFAYFSKPVIYGTLAAKLARAPKRIGMLEGLGYTFTEQPEGQPLKQKIIQFFQILLYKFTIPFLDRLIVLNPDDKQSLLEYGVEAKEISVLGGIGLDLSKYPYTAPIREPNIKFIFIGRLLKEKGINYFLDAAEIVKAKHPNSIFTILGGTEPDSSSSVSMNRLKDLCDKGVIFYPGEVSDIPHRIAESDVFVLPSYYREGVPRSTQEAMAVGRPVITTDVPGCRETVENKRNGLLIPPHNVEALVEAMNFFINNQDQIEVMGLEGHKMAVEKYDAAKVNEKLYKLIFS